MDTERKQCDARNIRELFRGRITESEVRILLRRFGLDKQKTVEYILSAQPGELTKYFEENGIEQRIAYVTKDNVLRDLATRNKVPWEVRQYGCEDCDNTWWRRVPTRKPVSRCNKCKRGYDPVSRDKEWGWGEFECDCCGNTFRGFAAMGDTVSQCYRCGNDCHVARILPPQKRESGNKGTVNRHSCNAHNCYNRKGKPDYSKTCMHPKSQSIKVFSPSKHHASTGSTVKTFLDQRDLVTEYEPSLGCILEENDADNE